ncbi:MAG TPA: T6SS effector amidase Tae4 family protein [Thermoanaerobaculia bacterium]|nr:T6SS effector amidase Tae4 family protein [Thermoanaerobaculia bacterium]
MAAIAKIRSPFNTILAAYPTNDRLPQLITDYIDLLKANKNPGDPDPTPCCLQISHALNAAGQKIYPFSYRRQNQPLGGNYYIGSVDELEHYLTARYGRTEDIKIGRTEAEMRRYLDGKQGILVFREGFAGAHTELWNKNSIIQKQGTPSGMNEGALFSKPRILFWEITDEKDANAVPVWLRGWWNVYDGNTYYYYFSDQHGVTYSKVAPASLGVAPAKKTLNEGTVTISATPPHVVIEWNPADGGATTESFTRVGWSSESEMNGVSNRYAPLFAKKMT